MFRIKNEGDQESRNRFSHDYNHKMVYQLGDAVSCLCLTFAQKKKKAPGRYLLAKVL
jgi:hypothetical protein